MLLFVKVYSRQIVIPLNRVFDIWSEGNALLINYDSGELIEIEGTYQKKVESVKVTFETDDDVNKALRQFYKACNAGAGAFFFGGV